MLQSLHAQHLSPTCIEDMESHVLWPLSCALVRNSHLILDNPEWDGSSSAAPWKASRNKYYHLKYSGFPSERAAKGIP